MERFGKCVLEFGLRILCTNGGAGGTNPSLLPPPRLVLASTDLEAVIKAWTNEIAILFRAENVG
jgi:hypothetical protein